MTALMHGLSGYIPVRNGDSLGYCWREAAMSLLPVVDELIFCDSDSGDGTTEAMQAWAKEHSETRNGAVDIRVINYPWPRLPTPEEVRRDDLTRPKGDPRMLIAWLNHARRECRFEYQITLDADEVLAPSAHSEIKRAMIDGLPRYFHRVNFWKDLRHEAPHGTVCGESVARMGPTRYDMCSDEPRPEGEPEIRKLAIRGPGLKIFHLGFLRRQDAFIRKSWVMQSSLHGCMDPRLRKAEETGESWIDLSPFPADRPLLGYVDRDVPEFCRPWLEAQGVKWE